MNIDEDGVITPGPNKEELLDHTPLMFGKYRGKTPSQVAELYGEQGCSYIRWMYETVDRDTCSHVLYKDCGGTRAKKPAKDTTSRIEPPAQQRPQQKTDKFGFDFDDDVPF